MRATVLTAYLITTLGVSASVMAYDSSEFELINHFEHSASPDDDSYHYHFKRWSIMDTGSFEGVSVMSNYDFFNGTYTPLKLGVTCIKGKYWINIATNRERVHPNSDFYDIGPDGTGISIKARFDNGSEQAMKFTNNYQLAYFSGEQSVILEKLKRTQRLHVTISRHFADGSSGKAEDVFEVAGADKALAPIFEGCKVSGR